MSTEPKPVPGAVCVNPIGGEYAQNGVVDKLACREMHRLRQLAARVNPPEPEAEDTP